MLGNILFGALGLLLFVVFKPGHAWFWFLSGWVFMTVNFEVLKRICLMLAPLFVAQEAVENPKKQVSKISPIVYMLVLVKISMWGILLAFLAWNTKIESVPFGVGILTILFSAIILGLKESIYART